MSVEFDSRCYDKYVDVNITIDGVKFELGFHDEIQSQVILCELEAAVDDMKRAMDTNTHFGYEYES